MTKSLTVLIQEKISLKKEILLFMNLKNLKALSIDFSYIVYEKWKTIYKIGSLLPLKSTLEELVISSEFEGVKCLKYILKYFSKLKILHISKYMKFKSRFGCEIPEKEGLSSVSLMNYSIKDKNDLKDIVNTLINYKSIDKLIIDSISPPKALSKDFNQLIIDLSHLSKYTKVGIEATIYSKNKCKILKHTLFNCQKMNLGLNCEIRNTSFLFEIESLKDKINITNLKLSTFDADVPVLNYDFEKFLENVQNLEVIDFDFEINSFEKLCVGLLNSAEIIKQINLPTQKIKINEIPSFIDLLKKCRKLERLNIDAYKEVFIALTEPTHLKETLWNLELYSMKEDAQYILEFVKNLKNLNLFRLGLLSDGRLSNENIRNFSNIFYDFSYENFREYYYWRKLF